MGRDSEYWSTWSKTVHWGRILYKNSSPVSRPKDIPEERDEVGYLSRFKISTESRRAFSSLELCEYPSKSPAVFLETSRESRQIGSCVGHRKRLESPGNSECLEYSDDCYAQTMAALFSITAS